MQERVHHHERVAEDETVHPLVGVLVGAERLVGDGVLRVAEQLEHGLLLVALVAGQRLDDGLGGQALVDEERQRRHVEGQPFGLARPVEEWARQTAELLDGVLERADGGEHGAIGGAQLARLVEGVGRGEGRGLRYQAQEPFADLSGGVLPVPAQRGRKGRVVSVGRRGLLLPELGLRPDLGAHRAGGLVVTVVLRDLTRLAPAPSTATSVAHLVLLVGAPPDSAPKSTSRCDGPGHRSPSAARADPDTAAVTRRHARPGSLLPCPAPIYGCRSGKVMGRLTSAYSGRVGAHGRIIFEGVRCAAHVSGRYSGRGATRTRVGASREPIPVFRVPVRRRRRPGGGHHANGKVPWVRGHSPRAWHCRRHLQPAGAVERHDVPRQAGPRGDATPGADGRGRSSRDRHGIGAGVLRGRRHQRQAGGLHGRRGTRAQHSPGTHRSDQHLRRPACAVAAAQRGRATAGQAHDRGRQRRGDPDRPVPGARV